LRFRAPVFHDLQQFRHRRRHPRRHPRVRPVILAVALADQLQPPRVRHDYLMAHLP